MILTKLLKKVFLPLYKFLVPSETAPFGSIDEDLSSCKQYLKGRVLNAGAGLRDISKFVDGELVNQDIERPDRNWIDSRIISPLHHIPTGPDHFDTIFCNAVLEHVENPDEIIDEFYRVLKSGGYLILGVPFLQPEHKSPTDYQRYTRDGLIRLVQKHRFHFLEIQVKATVFHTLYWQIWIWLHMKSTPLYILLRMIVLRPLLSASRSSTMQSDRLASYFQVIAEKPKVNAAT